MNSKIMLSLCSTPSSKLQVFNLKDLPSGCYSGSLHMYEGDKDCVFTESIGVMGIVDCDK